MKMETVFIALAVGLAMYGSYRFLRSATSIDDWVQAEARFVDSRIEEEVVWDGEGEERSGDYIVAVTYEYTDPFDHATKRSDNMLAGGKLSFLGVEVRPPFTLRKADAEVFVQELKQKGSFPVYINPKEPSDTGIVRFQDRLPSSSPATFWIVAAIAGSAAVGAIAAVYWIVEYRPDIVDGCAEKLRRWLEQ